MPTESAKSDSDRAEVLPSWKRLRAQLEAKDERIAELEEEVRRLRGDLGNPGDGRDGSDQDSSRAQELVDELRRTAESR